MDRNKQIITLEQEQKEYQNKINKYKSQHLSKYHEIRDASYIKILINDIKLKIKKLKKKRDIHFKNIKQIERFEIYQKELAN